MAKYMIHSYPQRMWYVEEHLLPSMLKQGIDRNNIVIYNDSEKKGNLRACMDAFSQCTDDGGTWHLQDDVCICERFKKVSELYDDGVVCAFSSEMYDGPGKIGEVEVSRMWFSFPCIRIPNRYARECSEWVLKHVIGNHAYKKYWEDGANDDWAFRTYMHDFHRNEIVLNLAPNLVNHVDYLIGGGSRRKRLHPCISQYWEETDMSVEKLKEQLGVQ